MAVVVRSWAFAAAEALDVVVAVAVAVAVVVAVVVAVAIAMAFEPHLYQNSAVSPVISSLIAYSYFPDHLLHHQQNHSLIHN